MCSKLHSITFWNTKGVPNLTSARISSLRLSCISRNQQNSVELRSPSLTTHYTNCCSESLQVSPYDSMAQLTAWRQRQALVCWLGSLYKWSSTYLPEIKPRLSTGFSELVQCFGTEDVGSIFFRNACTNTPDFTVAEGWSKNTCISRKSGEKEWSCHGYIKMEVLQHLSLRWEMEALFLKSLPSMRLPQIVEYFKERRHPDLSAVTF